MTVQSFESYAAARGDHGTPPGRLAIPARLRVSGGRAVPTTVHDLSPAGFSATAINRLNAGQICWLTLPGLSALQAEVIWWRDCQARCAFAQSLNPIVYENIISRHRSG